MKRYRCLTKFHDAKSGRLFSPDRVHPVLKQAGIYDLPDDWEPPEFSDRDKTLHGNHPKMVLVGYVDPFGTLYPGQEGPPKPAEDNVLSIEVLKDMKLTGLRKIAIEKGIVGAAEMKQDDLITALAPDDES